MNGNSNFKIQLLSQTKKVAFVFFLLISFTPSFSQQTPIYNQYFINPYLFNPAMVGESGETNLFFLYRNQWAGIEGSPETQVLTVDGRLKNRNVGIGISIFNDITNVIGRTSGSLTAAYRFNITKDQIISLGMSTLIIQNRIFFDRLIAEDVTDPGLMNELNQQTAFDLNFGFNYTRKNLKIGVAIDQLLQDRVNFRNASQLQSISYTHVRHYIGIFTYDYQIREKFTVKPILVARLVQGLSPQYDFNMVVKYDNRIWLSAAYRHQIGIGGSLGFHFDDQFTIGYAYEFPNSDLSVLGTGTHEFTLGLTMFSKSSRDMKGNRDKYKRNKNLSNYKTTKEKSEKISQLQQEKEQYRNDLQQTESLINRQQLEILKLRQTILDLQGDMKILKQSSQYTLGQKQENSKKANYYLVIGAFRKLENAKTFQKIVKREGKINASVIQNENDSWYLIYTEKLTEFSNLDKKISNLERGEIADLIVGKPWIFRKTQSE